MIHSFTTCRFLKFLLFLLLIFIFAACKSNPSGITPTDSALDEGSGNTIMQSVSTEPPAKADVSSPSSTPAPPFELSPPPTPATLTIAETTPTTQAYPTATCNLSGNDQSYRHITEIKQAGEFITQITVSKGLLYVFDSNEQVLSVLDVTQPYNFEIVKQIDLSDINPKYTIRFTATDHYLYIFNWADPNQVGLQIFSAENFAHIHKLRDFTREELERKTVTHILQSDSYAYITLTGNDNIRFLDLQTFEILKVHTTLDTKGYAESSINPIVETDNYIFAINYLTEPFKSPQSRLVIFEKSTLTDWHAMSTNISKNLEQLNNKFSLLAQLNSNGWSNPVPNELLAFDELLVFDALYPIDLLTNQTVHPSILQSELNAIAGIDISAYRAIQNGEMVISLLPSLLHSEIGDIAMLDNIVYVVTKNGDLFTVEFNLNC